jgi:restriction system protein
MLMPDDSRLILPLLTRLSAAAAPISIDELAEDHDLARLAPPHWERVVQGLEWVLRCMERQQLVLGCGNNRYAITESGLRHLDRRDRGMPFNDRETLSRTYERIDNALRAELLARLYGLSPASYESVVVHLLVAMGYGREAAGLARRLGKSGDGGIDGVIPEDELGLDSIYVQAKRYRPNTSVSVNEIRDFAGSLELHKAHKGIFATTATFSRPAQDFAGQISRRIVLVDGERFCELMVKHNIGVRPIQKLELKEIDDSYFSSDAGSRILTEQINSASIQPRR